MNNYWRAVSHAHGDDLEKLKDFPARYELST